MKKLLFSACVLPVFSWLLSSSVLAQPSVEKTLESIGAKRGILAVLAPTNADDVIGLAKASELILYVQTTDSDLARTVRQAAQRAGQLGRGVFVDVGPLATIHLGENVADAAIVGDRSIDAKIDSEILRVLRPRGIAIIGDRKLVKPVPEGIDQWTHPYHGPDNNPQSTDQLLRGDLRTQFLGYPLFSPMPEQSVVAGGRIFKALGHIAHKANQNEMLNTLLCINAYNGVILWKRPTPKGFMIHRNTMIATDDALYMGDHESCKVFDARTGQLRDEFTIPEDLTDGPVWKWMAMRDGVLYALVGNPEIQVDTQKSDRRGLGHWPWGMWKGHDYSDPRTAFGYGRTLVAIDLESKKLIWHYRDEEFLDARGVCMNDGKIFCFSPGRFLLAVDHRDGKLLWKNSDKDLLAAISPNARAQHYTTGYSTSCYIKCNEDYVFFAGPQRNNLVAASSIDGKLAWTQSPGNLQLVLRDDAIYAAGPQGTKGVKIDYASGKVLDEFPARRACTRATGCVDSIFFRASGGTVRVKTESNSAHHIAPMRPPCQDGVIVSNGHLYWGPWMCGCQLSLYGNIALAAAQPPPVDATAIYQNARHAADNIDEIQPLKSSAGDWTTYRGDNARSDQSQVAIADRVDLHWTAEVCETALPTAPVVAGDFVFVADRTGTVSAFDTDGNSLWQFHTAGPIYYPPTIADDRLFVGSADGCVYALEACTGRFLWSFRVGPTKRRIPVYGQLISTWPVSGGVVVQDNTVYAAAGIAHYDGTYVVALDTETGHLKASNTRSGVIASEVNNGISLQGNLSIVDGELRFLAGGVYETARYDLESLRCLNDPKVQVTSQFRTAFYPYYPNYGKYVSLDYTCDDGCVLTHDASYEGSVFTNLALGEPLPPGVDRPRKEASRWLRRRGQPVPKAIWRDEANRRFTGFVVTPERLLFAGHPDARPDKPVLAAIKVRDGKQLWQHALPANAVKGGTSMGHDGRIYVSLEDGKLMCFQPAAE